MCAIGKYASVTHRVARQHPGSKLDAFRQGPSDQRHCDDCEGRLERHPDPGGNSKVINGRAVEGSHQAELFERVREDPRDRLSTVGHRPSPQRVDDGNYGERTKDHHHHVEY
jgi:hypothetical protein